jgi:hypothetical protein
MAKKGLDGTLNAISTLFIVGTAVVIFIGAGMWYRSALPQVRES